MKKGSPVMRSAQTARDHRTVWGLWLAALVLFAWVLWLLIAEVVSGLSSHQSSAPSIGEVQMEPLFEGVDFGVMDDLPPWPSRGLEPAAIAQDALGRTSSSGNMTPTVGIEGRRPSQQSGSTGDASGFAALDRNGDGRISPAEFAIFHLDGIRPGWKGGKADDMPPYVSTRSLNRSAEELRRADVNNDWFLSPGEFETFITDTRAASLRFSPAATSS